MARAVFSETIANGEGQPIASGTIEVRARSDNSLADLYDAETGGNALSNPLDIEAADDGLAEFWVEEGEYSVTVTSGGVSETYKRDIVSAKAAAYRDIVFDTLTEAISYEKFSIGEVFRTLGYNTIGDGGGNDYRVVAAATGTDDGGEYIDLTGSGLQGQALFLNGANVNQWGATGDGTTDDTAEIQAALTWWRQKVQGATRARLSGVDDAEYRITNSLTINFTSNVTRGGVLDFSMCWIKEELTDDTKTAFNILTTGAIVHSLDIWLPSMEMSNAADGIKINGGASTSSEQMFESDFHCGRIENIPEGSRGLVVIGNVFESQFYQPRCAADSVADDTHPVYFGEGASGDLPTSIMIYGGTTRRGEYGALFEDQASATWIRPTFLLAGKEGCYMDAAGVEMTLIAPRFEKNCLRRDTTYQFRGYGRGTVIQPYYVAGSERFTVQGGGQTGTTLVVDGFSYTTDSHSGAEMDPRVGDTFTIAGVTGTYEITAVTDNMDGSYDLTLDSSLASSPADNAVCKFDSIGPLNGGSYFATGEGITVIGGGQSSDTAKTVNQETTQSSAKVYTFGVPTDGIETEGTVAREDRIRRTYDTSAQDLGSVTGNVDIDLSDGYTAYCTATGNITIQNPSNALHNELWEIHVLQDGTGGRTIGFQSGKFRVGSFSATTTADTMTILRFRQRSIGGTRVNILVSAETGL